MPSMRYTAEEKENTLRLCDEVGVAKASEQTGISKFTLYKWRSGAEGEAAMPTAEAEEIPAGAVEAEGQATGPNREGRSVGKRYSAEEKAKVLRLCDEIGLAKVSKQTGITFNSLRKWRMEAKDEIPVNAATPKKSPSEETVPEPSPHTDKLGEGISEESVRLRLENSALKAQIIALKNALRAFTE